MLSAAAPAAAQESEAAESEPAPAPADTAARPPDIVKLKNGGLVRGTISELVPDDAVVIVTLTGETRRFPMTEVEYAGPDKPSAQQAPPRKKPVEEPTEREPDTPSTLTARLESVDVPIKFFAASDEPGSEYSELCTAPCDTQLAPGNYRFGLSAPDSEEPLAAMPILRLTGPAAIRGKFRSRAGLRAAGGLTLFIGTIAGILLWATASSEVEDCSVNGVCTTIDVPNEAQRWSGILITGGSIITGLILITRGDSASVELVPGAPTAFRTPGRLDAARDLGARSSTPLSGLTLVGRF